MPGHGHGSGKGAHAEPSRCISQGARLDGLTARAERRGACTCGVARAAEPAHGRACRAANFEWIVGRQVGRAAVGPRAVAVHLPAS